MKKNSREYEVFRKYENKKKVNRNGYCSEVRMKSHHLRDLRFCTKFVPTIECLAELGTTRNNCCNNLSPFKR